MSERDEREDVNDAVEDALGFNLRSVKTLIDLSYGHDVCSSRTLRAIA